MTADPDVALEHAGFLRPNRRVTVLSRGWLTSTYRVRGDGLDAVLKLHCVDVLRMLTEGADPRFGTLAKLFPIAPFFRPTAMGPDAVRGVVSVPVPEVIGEGCLEDGTRYTLLRHLEGRPWRPSDWNSPERRSRASAAVGSLAAACHRAPIEQQCSREDWLAGFAEILHCLADHLADTTGRRQSSLGYHRRFAAVVDRLGRTELGPMVRAHCDLHPANLLFDAEDRICGLVDFQLACTGPAALDFRWLALLDEVAFCAAYDRFAPDPDEACWLGHCFDMYWQALATVAMQKLGGSGAPQAVRTRSLGHFEYLLSLCGDDRLRRGPAWRRREEARVTDIRVSAHGTLRDVGRPRHTTGPSPVAPSVTVVVPAFNHVATTTAPCLAALRWFTDVPYRIVCVDNGSSDGTRAMLERLARCDDRIELVAAERNLGWAQGTLLGLTRLRSTDTHVVLLNSDTLVTPRWLSKLLWHLDRSPDRTVMIPNEWPDGGPGEQRAEAIRPGSAEVPPVPSLAEVLDTSAALERRYHRSSRPAMPSGFCLLFRIAELPIVESYLANFEAYHSGRLDWYSWWTGTGAQCRVALDDFVFHARGGSGGYYDYRRTSAR